MRVIALLSAAMLATLAIVAQAAASAAYTIRFERPFAVGQTHVLNITDTMRSTRTVTTPGEPPSRSETFRRVVLDAESRIDEVDAKGRFTALSLKIRTLTMQNSSGAAASLPKPVLPAGTQLTVRYREGVPLFESRDGRPLEESALDALQLAFRPRQEQKFNDDDRFGTAAPRRVGESWPVNVNAFIPDRTAPHALDPDKTSGRVTLKSVRDIAGVERALVEANIASAVTGTGAAEYTMDILISAQLPTDVARSQSTMMVKSTTRVVAESETLAGKARREIHDVELTNELAWVAR